LEGYTQAVRDITDSVETDPNLAIHDSFRKAAPNVTGLSPAELLEPLTSDAYFRFAVVRNPYKRIFSAWQSKLLLREPLQVAPYLQYDFLNHPIEKAEDIATSFEYFLEHLAANEAPSYWDVHWTPQVTLLRPDLINYSQLVRIEDSGEITEALSARLGERFVNPFEIRRINESLVPYLSSFMTGRSVELIQTLYAKDFEAFGYDKRPPGLKRSFSTDQLNLTRKAVALIRGRNQRLGERTGQIAGLNQAVAVREGQIGNLTRAVAERDGQIARLNQALAAREGQIGNLNDSVTERDGLIDHLNQAIAERDGQIDSLIRAVAEREDQITELNQAVAVREGQIGKLNDAVTERDGRIDHFNQGIAEREGQIGNLTRAVAERDGQIARLNQALAARERQIGNLNDAVTERDGLIEHINQRIAEREGQIDNITRAVAEREGQIANLNNAVTEREEQIDHLNQSIAKRDAEVANLNQTLVERAGAIVDLHHGVAKRDQEIAALRSSHSWRITKPLRLMSSFLHKRSGETPEANPSDHQNSTKDCKALPKGFDPDVYLALNPDLAKGGVDPVTHYLNHGCHEGRIFLHAEPNDDHELNAVGGWIAQPLRGLSALFGAKRKQLQTANMNSLKQPIALVKHGLEELAQYFGELPKGFDPDVYLKLNADLSEAGVDPIAHYLRHGRHEGRAFSLPDICANFELNVDRETVLVVGHEASRTGAPVLTLNLVQALSKRYNVVVLLLGGGPLSDAFLNAAMAVMTAPNARGNPVLAELIIGHLCERFKLKFAMVNSIEGRIVLPSLGNRFVPSITLIHEFASCYPSPRDVFALPLIWSTELVFSTTVTMENALSECPGLVGWSAHVLPQGRCLVPLEEFSSEQLQAERSRIRSLIRPKGAADKSVVVLGAGYVHLRKGVDLFIDCAARVARAPEGDRCRFIWIGKGYDPENDPGYSVYLADQVRRAGLQERVFFIDETAAIETAYEEADLFLLSSRLDPLPNVAIDAMAHGVPVLCFDKTTGIAEFLIDSGLRSYCVAAYLDSADMAEKILTLAGSQVLRAQVAKQSRETSMTYFDMKKYVDRLESLTQDACDRSKREKSDTQVILGSGLFRRDFACSWQGSSIEKNVCEYVRTWASGTGRRKPFPGFHPGIYLEQHGLASEGVDPFADYLRAGRPDGPWHYPVIVAGETRQTDLPDSHRVALHLHVYYPELLQEITSRLSRNLICPDLFVSITNEEACDLVVNQLENYKGNIVDIQLVPNRGRDIGPFFNAFAQKIRGNYDFIGHIHTKKSAVVKDDAIGESWFRFLLENLLGGESGTMMDSILGKMNDDKSIGMVFPDDPWVVTWGSNRVLGESLAVRIGIQKLPEHLIFPVGTMFWARTSELAPLMNLKLDWDDYPHEPLPYDGTLLHAIERLFPSVISLGNFRCATTNVVGLTR
jgi:glycosyltransferase involved in cell wall biosynthesis/peptidoglycan hydrolase CwlO-like protein